MNPEYPRAFLAAKARERDSWPESVRSCRSIRKPAKERFPRDPYQNRMTHLDEGVQRSQQSQIMFGLLSKPDSWINRNSFHGHAVAYSDRNSLLRNSATSATTSL